MSLTVEDFGGRQEATSVANLRNYLSKRDENGANAYWLSHSGEIFPKLSILLKDGFSTCHYFPVKSHPGYVPMRGVDALDQESFTTFYLDPVGEEISVSNSQVVDASVALQVAIEFFASAELPPSITWLEL